VLFWGLLAVVAVAVTLLSSPYWFPTEWLRRRFEQELERALPVEASVGEVSVRLGLGMRVRWRDVTLVSEADGARLDLSVDSGDGEVSLAQLLSGELQVPTVTLESVRGRLRVGPAGLRPLLNSWQAKKKEQEAQAQAEEKAGKGRPRRAPVVKHLQVSDLVLSLVNEQGAVLQSTPHMDLGVDVKSLAPPDIRISVNGRTFVAEASLSQSGSVTGRIRNLRGISLNDLCDSLRLLVSPDTPRVSGLVRDGKIDFSSDENQVTIEVAVTLEQLEAQAPQVPAPGRAGTFSTTRLRVPEARVTLRPTKDALECTLEKLAIETDAFDLSLPGGAIASSLAQASGTAAAPASSAPGAEKPAPSAAGTLREPATLRLAGQSLSGSLAGSLRVSPEEVTGSVQTLEPLHVRVATLAASDEARPRRGRTPEASEPSGEGSREGSPVNFAELSRLGPAELVAPALRAPGQAPAVRQAHGPEESPGAGQERRGLPLLAAAEAWLRLADAEVTWRPGEAPMTAFSGSLDFTGTSATGLLAQLAPAVTSAPLEGKVNFRTRPSTAGARPQAGGPAELVETRQVAATGDALLRSRSLSVKKSDFEVVVGPWEFRSKFSVSAATGQLDLTEARWSSAPVRLAGLLRGAPIALGARSSSATGSLTVLREGTSWSLLGSGDASIGPLSLRARDGEAASIESLQLTGSARAAATDEKLQLAALEATASIVGGQANERVRSWLPPRLQSLGVALAGDGQLSLRYDGSWLDVEARATGREVALTAPPVFGPSPLRLDGLRGEVALRLAPDAGEVTLTRCQLESPQLQLSARGVLRRTGPEPAGPGAQPPPPGARHSLQLIGRVASNWSALGPSWLALAEALPPKLHDALVRFSFEGQASLEDVVISGPLNQLTLSAEANLDGSAVRFDGGLIKAAESRGRMPLRLVLGERVRLEDLALDLEGLPLVRVAGETDRELSQARVHLTIEQFEQASLKEVRPELAQLALSGGLSVEAVLEDLLESPTGQAQVHFDHLGVEVVGPEGVHLELDGTVTVTPASISCEDLRVAVDGSDLAVSGRLENYLELLARLREGEEELSAGARGGEGAQAAEETLPQLRAVIRAEVLDVTRFQQALFNQGPAGETEPAVVELTSPTVVELVPPARPPTGAQPSRPGTPAAPEEPPATLQVAIDRQAVMDWLSRWLPRLGVELAGSGSVEVAELRTSQVTLQDFTAAWQLTDGVLLAEVCRSRMSGGEFDASGTLVNLDRWPPSYQCAYRTFDLGPEPAVADMVSRRFPGLSFTGRMADEGTLEGLAGPEPGEWASSVSGETHSSLTDGVLVFPLPLPEYIRRLFPSLNANRYGFSTMTNEATITAGAWHNIMKFDGYPEIYVAGTTEVDGSVEYEAGLRLLAPGGIDIGRLPVAHFTGRIQGTEFATLEGTFISPPQLVAKLLTEGLYRNFKTGVLDLGYLRSLQRNVPIPGLDLFINGLDLFLDVTIRLIPGLGKEKPAPAP
jgi:hypothetical protein